MLRDRAAPRLRFRRRAGLPRPALVNYRTAGGAEIDLLLRFPDGCLWAVEVRRSLAPRPRRGFHSACVDLGPEGRLVVYPGTEVFPLSRDMEAVPLATLARRLRDGARS